MQHTQVHGPLWDAPLSVKEAGRWHCKAILDNRYQLWQLGDASEDWRKANDTLMFKGKKKDPANYKLVSPTLSPGKMKELLTLETTARHIKDMKIIQSSQPHEFL